MRLYGRTPFWSGSLTIRLPREASEGDTEAKLTFPPCLSSGGTVAREEGGERVKLDKPGPLGLLFARVAAWRLQPPVAPRTTTLSTSTSPLLHSWANDWFICK